MSVINNFVMSVAAFIVSDWRIAAFVAVVIATVAWNMINRIQWDLAWIASGNERTFIPERCWSYDAHDLEVFANAAGRAGMLGFYVNAILRRSDVCFAIALSAITAFIWYRIAVTPMVCWIFNWAALPLGAMAILYGIADVAEDIKLATILNHRQSIDRADAAATNMLTRIKMATLTLSLIGVVIFGVVSLVETLTVRVRSRRPTPART
jgi:hypothetical protein